jgi:2,3-dihydroxybiphenyl 1,2-dioxygenase
MSTINALGYIRMNAPDLDAWRTYGTDILGLQVAERTAATVGDGALYLRQDDRSYRLALDAGEDASTTLGWEVANRQALDGVAAKLDAAGFSVEEATAEYAQSRLVIGMLRCDDPAGNKCEFFYGGSSDKDAFVSPTGAQFSTDDMGLGHVFSIVPDGKAFEDFYTMLGFKVSDYIALMPGMTATFMHCNERHHTLAFLEVPGISAVQHVMLEVDAVDSVGRSYDKCIAAGTQIVMSLGRHTNDEMFSFYSASPNGVAFEYGTGGIKVDDDTWTVQQFDAASYWGHSRPEPIEIPTP